MLSRSTEGSNQMRAGIGVSSRAHACRRYSRLATKNFTGGKLPWSGGLRYSIDCPNTCSGNIQEKLGRSVETQAQIDWPPDTSMS